MSSIVVHTVSGPLDAIVTVPGSKSIANRALVCAALADGVSHLDNVPDGDDTAAMLECLGLLGVDVDRSPAGSTTITGTGGILPVPRQRDGQPVVLPTRLAGTTSRFVTALAALGTHPYVIDGDPPLRSRPMAPLHDALTALGARVEARGSAGHIPVMVTGPLTGCAELALRSDVSSQFLTALMLIGPYVPGGLRVALTTPLVSRPYVEITRAVMAGFGHEAVRVGAQRIEVDEGGYRGRDYSVEPDASSASYPLAAAAIVGGRVEVAGLTKGSVQGDAAFADVLATMGCSAMRTEHSTTVESRAGLRGIDIDMVDLSDLVPTVAAVATFASSATRISGVGFIRAKESDRLGDLCNELRTLGAAASETADGLTIEPSTLHGARVATHHDHRLAMALGLVGLRVPGVEIDDRDVVAKSWPAYWTMLGDLR